MIRVDIIVEDTARENFECEHGLAIGIDVDGKRLLFDTGASDLFLRNAQRMGFFLDTVDTVVLSHAHYDHTNGLSFLENKNLIAHPGCFDKTYSAKKRYIGAPLTEQECQARFDLCLSKAPLKIAENIIFLGEIPRTTNFESKQTAFVNAEGQSDYVLDDSAIVIKTPKGNVLVTGCSHSGIINIIKYAKKVTGNDRFAAVIGGFHLREMNDIVIHTVEQLKIECIETLYPLHCTTAEVIEYMGNKLGNVVRVKAGDTIIIDNKTGGTI